MPDVLAQDISPSCWKSHRGVNVPFSTWESHLEHYRLYRRFLSFSLLVSKHLWNTKLSWNICVAVQLFIEVGILTPIRPPDKRVMLHELSYFFHEILRRESSARYPLAVGTTFHWHRRIYYLRKVKLNDTWLCEKVKVITLSSKFTQRFEKGKERRGFGWWNSHVLFLKSFISKI